VPAIFMAFPINWVNKDNDIILRHWIIMHKMDEI